MQLGSGARNSSRRAAGLSDNPGFDLLSHRPDEGNRGIEVKGRVGIGDVELTENEWAKACNERDRYWLYVVFHCTTPNPSLNILHDPSTLDWQPIVKVEHYRLRQNSIAHPVELREESSP